MDADEEQRATAGEGAGDLGRRVRERRLELGLTVEEVARRAGMEPGYLEYLESNVASATSLMLLRLAGALETTSALLVGGGLERPPGRSPAAASPVLEELEAEECRRLLEQGGVGRVVFTDDRGPVALPVNFRLLDGEVVFRTANDGVVARAVGRRDTPIGFEVDHVDDALAEGWSVLIRGRARPLGDAHDLAGLAGLEPWTGGERSLYVRVAASELTGRRIRARS